MVDLQHLQDEYSDRGLTVLGFDSADRPEIARDLLDKYGVTYPCILDSSSDAQVIALNEYQAYAVPTTYVIDREGRVAAAWIGHRAGGGPRTRVLRELGILEEE